MGIQGDRFYENGIGEYLYLSSETPHIYASFMMVFHEFFSEPLISAYFLEVSKLYV